MNDNSFKGDHLSLVEPTLFTYRFILLLGVDLVRVHSAGVDSVGVDLVAIGFKLVGASSFDIVATDSVGVDSETLSCMYVCTFIAT